MSAIIKYIHERFPVFSVLLFSLGYAALSLGVSFRKNIWTQDPQNSFISLCLLSSVFFFFLLRQRTVDEFRDADHDKKYFPDRPVPRGLISKYQILYLGLFAFATEFISAYQIGRHAFGLYLLFFLYSLLMAKEFFISKWLNKHFTIYFLVHEVVFLILGLFFVSAVNSDVIALSLKTVVLLIILTVSPMSIEVTRKFKPRYDKSGKAVADTYSTVWGRSNALSILIFLSLTVGIGFTFLKHTYIYLLFSIISTIAWLSFAKKSDSAAILIGAINFLGFALLANIVW